MALYAIGDIQGCYDELQRLLEKLHFDACSDQLWLVGDLVNRGPKSLEVLRFVKALGDGAITVLGNHDLHLLATAAGIDRVKRDDTFGPIQNAPDRDELLDWLRHRPLLHNDVTCGFAMVHAGLPPQWDLAQALRCASEVESMLRSDEHKEFFQHMYGNEPDLWREDLSGWARLRFIVNCFTRLRYVDAAGRVLHKEKSAPHTRRHLTPWFRASGRESAATRIVFGHWSTLGLVIEHNVYALDTGCVWGGALTALRLDAEPASFSIDCPQRSRPES
jgi:bis(5'-nucleosyl)-tetraphosphatase (symmetrical)